METVTAKATLIRVDTVLIERAKESFLNRVDLLNKFVKLTENTLKTSFNEDERIKLKDQGVGFVKGWLKPKFKFPDADEGFNLQALGLDLSPIQRYWDNNSQKWRTISPEIDNGAFIIPNLDQHPDIKRHYYYAKNEKQEKAYREATEVCEALNRFLDNGLITGLARKLCDGFKFVRYGTETNIQDPKLPVRFYPKEWEILKQ